MENIDAQVLVKIIEAQNILSSLPSQKSIVLHCEQILASIPGVRACSVCLSDAQSSVGLLNNKECADCVALRQSTMEEASFTDGFICKLAEKPEKYFEAIETEENKFGYFIFEADDTCLFELYRPYVHNLGCFVALVLENRMQRDMSKEAYPRDKKMSPERENLIPFKFSSILSPVADIGSLELSDIIDSDEIQKLMDELYLLTRIGIGIIDIHGKVLVRTGWQDICSKFHRVNPESCKLCVESDIELTHNVPAGTFKQYRCKNNLWDIATPIILGNKHVGNIFLGQFLYDDEVPDYGIFRQQASRYSFDEQEYLDALDRVPRWSHEIVNTSMSFYSTFAMLIGNLSYSNIKLANALEERKRAEEALRHLNRELRAISNSNQILLHADDEQVLLREICNLICSEVGYRMAWVGYAERDEAKTIRQVANAGVVGDYFGQYRFTWAEEGKDLVGAALRTGNFICIQDLTKNTENASWKVNALRYGYRSCIALPLKALDASTFGVLVACSSEPATFTYDEIRLIKRLSGDLAFGIVTLRTRAEHKRAGEALQASKERFSKVFRLSPIAIAISRYTDNCIVDVNENFLKLTGYTREEIIGKTSKELNLYADPEEQEEIHQKLHSQGSLTNFEFKFKNKSGEIGIGLNTTIVLDLDHENNYLSLLQDITERKQAEKELIEAKEKAEESDRLKSSFLSNMSHEIRTPMNAIIGFAGFLNDPDVSAESKQYFTQIIKERSYDLLRIVEDILDISKIEVGQMQLINSEVSLRNLMNGLYEYYKLKTKLIDNEYALSFNYFLADDLKDTIIIADGQRLKQILNNLLDNAFKFTQKGSIEFGCKTDSNSELLFYVKDTGIGINADKHEIIFDRFRQAEDLLSTRRYGGTGLGLSIIKGLITLMNGKVWLESQINEGSTFYFSLPLHLSEDSVKTSLGNLKLEQHSSWANKVILIVEDDKANSNYLKVALSKKNPKILLAYTGEEALKVIKNNPDIDLILMDIRLPDTNGLNLTRIVKKDNPRIVIIAQTAYASNSDMKECLDAGCNNYISKPINYEQLIIMIDHYFNM